MGKASDFHDTRMWDVFNDFHFFCDTHRFQKLLSRAEFVRMIRDVPGDIVDAGAYKGISTLQFAHALESYQPNSRNRVLAFDTFDATFPKLREDEVTAVERLMETYDTTAYERLSEAVTRLGLEHRIEIIRGDITETLPSYIADNPGFRISLLHCDLDVYDATLMTLEAAWPRVVSGGVIVFDEYAVAGWGESDAVDTFFATLDLKPELKMLPITSTPTAYCSK